LKFHCLKKEKKEKKKKDRRRGDGWSQFTSLKPILAKLTHNSYDAYGQNSTPIVTLRQLINKSLTYILILLMSPKEKASAITVYRHGIVTIDSPTHNYLTNRT